MNTNFSYHIKDGIKIPSNKRGGFRRQPEDGVCLKRDCFAPLAMTLRFPWRSSGSCRITRTQSVAQSSGSRMMPAYSDIDRDVGTIHELSRSVTPPVFTSGESAPLRGGGNTLSWQSGLHLMSCEILLPVSRDQNDSVPVAVRACPDAGRDSSSASWRTQNDSVRLLTKMMKRKYSKT